MEKKKVYLSQVSIEYGNNSAYLPYAVGLLAANAWSDEKIKDAYELGDFLFLRDKIEDVVEKLDNPFFVGFSTYVWNAEYNKNLAKKIKEKYPSCFILFGGHHVPPQDKFLEEYDFIDFLIHEEGEDAFKELLLALSEAEGCSDIDKIDFSCVPNLSYRKDGEIINNPVVPISGEDYPSPYLEGYFDKIIAEHPDLKFSAILETSRGCPNRCAYCDWGCLSKKIKKFPMEKIRKEIEWYGENKIDYLWGADSNFGIFDRDKTIADWIIDVNRRTGYPDRFRTNYAKEQYENVFEISRSLTENGLIKFGVTLSFQSLSPTVLKNIGRHNMELEYFNELLRMYNRANMTTYSELILGLPGETYESFCEGLGKLLEAGQHTLIHVFNCELLPNSVMGRPDYMKKHGIEVAVTPIIISHSNPEEIEMLEYSNIIVQTNTMSKEKWIRSNIFARMEEGFHHKGLLRCFAIYLYYEKGVKYHHFYDSLVCWIEKNKPKITGFIYDFMVNELSNVVNEHPIKPYVNPEFGETTWELLEVAFLEGIYNFEEFYEEIDSFLCSFGIEKELHTELLKYQKAIIKYPGKDNFDTDLKYDFYHYFKEILSGGYTPLEKKNNVLHVNNGFILNNWEEYARFALWYGRQGGTFNPGLTVTFE